MVNIIHKTSYWLYLAFAFLWYSKLLPTFISSTFIIIFYFFEYIDFFTALILVGVNLLMILSYHTYNIIIAYEKELKLNMNNLTSIQDSISKLFKYSLVLEILTTYISFLAGYKIYILGLNILWLSTSIVFCNLIIYSILLTLLKSSINFKLSLIIYLFSSFIINYIFGASTAYIAHDVLLIPKIYDLTIVTFLPIAIQSTFFIVLLNVILTNYTEKEFDENIDSIISNYKECIKSINMIELESSMIKKEINIKNNYPIFVSDKRSYIINTNNDGINIYNNKIEKVKNIKLEKMVKYYNYIKNKQNTFGKELITKLIAYVSNQTEKDLNKILTKIDENKDAYKNRTDLEKQLTFSDLQIQLLRKKDIILDNKLDIIKRNYLIYPSYRLFEEAHNILLEINDLHFEWQDVLENRSKLWDEYTEHIPIKYHNLKNIVNKNTTFLLAISKELSFFD